MALKLVVEKTAGLGGSVTAPPSKSHTHRAVLIASLADGVSTIRNSLMCDDTLATIDACGKLGAKLEVSDNLQITGVSGKPRRSDTEVNARDSGTTMRFMAATFALCGGATTLTAGESLRARPIAPLLASLTDLGVKRARALSNGCPPVSITGPMTGGRTTLNGESSQYLSALLLACPLAKNDSMIAVSDLNSMPYVRMTIGHLERAGARLWSKDLENFFIPGGQSYRPNDYTVPGDYSSAAFLLAAAEITGSDIEVRDLEPGDAQGDRDILRIIGEMRSGERREIGLKDNPDLLPVLAVLGCYADGETVLKDAAHARAKESDRISAVCTELKKMGADIVERDDGLAVRNSKLRGAELDGHNDHRIIMALAVAGLAAEGRTIINGADAISKSYPGFARDLASLGADIRAVE